MDSGASGSHHYQAFLPAFNNVAQNSTDENLWNQTTVLGLRRIVTRVQSDKEPLGPVSGYGHLFCARGLRAERLKDNQQSLNLDCNQLPEIGAFLLRLIGMKPQGFVQIWQENYQACVINCLDVQ